MLRPRSPAILKRFVRAQDGATAVEFAIVGIPFFFMLFMMLELAIVLAISMSLDDAMRSASRRIRTGELQEAGGASLASFREDVCNRMLFMETHCRTHLTLDVRTYPQWADATPPEPVGADGEFNESEMTFVPGGAEDIVLARAYYRWKLITPFLSQALVRVGGTDTIVTSTVTFRNEPYEQ